MEKGKKQTLSSRIVQRALTIGSVEGAALPDSLPERRSAAQHQAATALDCVCEHLFCLDVFCVPAGKMCPKI